MRPIRICLVGDRNDQHDAHRAIPLALARAAGVAEREAQVLWLPTPEVDAARLGEADGIWCVPASPYASMQGALAAIRFARERGVPFLGTCGGFQHALLEYARNVLGLTDADHAESNPGAAVALIAPLACALRGVEGDIHLQAGSRMREVYGADEVREGYFCSYGLAPAFRQRLDDGKLRVAAVDGAGDVRGVELTGHPFFMAALFQPERSALAGRTHPVVVAFIRAAIECSSR
jgi:CTP synthase (UTP-ammonia lyase)